MQENKQTPRDLRKVVVDPTASFSQRMDWPTTIAALSVIALFFIWGVTGGDSIGSLMNNTLKVVTHNFGWVLMFMGIGLVLFATWLAIGPYGHIKIGPDDAKPEFSNFAWFSMLFTGAYGVGITYWGTAEALTFYVTPPLHLASQSREAAEIGMAWAFSHWGFIPWAMYLCYSVAIGYFVYRKGRPLRYSSALPDRIRLAWNGRVASIVDGFMISSMILASMTGLGFGIRQLAAGLSAHFGIEVSAMLYMLIAVVWVALYGFSAISGIYKGIQILGKLNMWLAIGLMLFVFTVGPTTFITNLFTDAMGNYLDSFFKMSFWTDPIAEGGFPQGWTIFYWAWWIASIPVIAAFCTRISYGRTFREVVLTFMILSTTATWMWFSTFGGTTLWLDLKGGVDMVTVLSEKGTDGVVYGMLAAMPMSSITTVLFMILVVIFLATTADATSYNCATLCTGPRGDVNNPSKILRGIWAVILGVGAVFLIIHGEGISSIQMCAVVACVVCVFVYIITLWYMVDELKKSEKTRYALQTDLAERDQKAGA